MTRYCFSITTNFLRQAIWGDLWEVRKEGRINKDGTTLQDLLYLSGGIKQSAEFQGSRYPVLETWFGKACSSPTRTILRTIKIMPNIEMTVSKHIILRPYDQV
ncbi:MAG: hypothetical protein IPH68_16890 [Chitinophagaceae bacterium]|nr:hypothetical protein [Chitinophagaceae bacterium]